MISRILSKKDKKPYPPPYPIFSPLGGDPTAARNRYFIMSKPAILIDRSYNARPII